MTENLQTTIAEHQAIYSAIAAHDPEATEKAMRQHLSISREEILKVKAQLKEIDSDEIQSASLLSNRP
jgi:DNA-binding FadR family transcriptional regulator